MPDASLFRHRSRLPIALPQVSLRDATVYWMLSGPRRGSSDFYIGVTGISMTGTFLFKILAGVLQGCPLF